MPKKMLVVALAVSLFAITGCPELKTLRQQNKNLQASLTSSQQDLSRTQSELATVTSMRDKYKDQLALATTESGRLSGLVKQLQDQQSMLEKQRADLADLVKSYIGSGVSVEERGGGNFIVMDNDILFDSGKVDLKAKAKAALDKVADYLVKNPGVPVRIYGYSDGVPIHVSKWQDNYELSAMRAHSVMRYLMSKGVDPKRMSISGFGPNRPPRAAPDAGGPHGRQPARRDHAGPQGRPQRLRHPQGLREGIGVPLHPAAASARDSPSCAGAAAVRDPAGQRRHEPGGPEQVLEVAHRCQMAPPSGPSSSSAGSAPSAASASASRN